MGIKSILLCLVVAILCTFAFGGPRVKKVAIRFRPYFVLVIVISSILIALQFYAAGS